MSRTENTPETSEREFVIMMGVPASGKSTIANRMFNGTHDFIDCDAIKKSHPDYDPDHPGLLHAWSKGIEAGLLESAFTNPVGNITYDTTGTNHEKVLNYANRATDAGYSVRVVFVTITEAESLRRNSLRDRVVETPILLKKFGQISEAATLVSAAISDFTTVDNNAIDPTLDPANDTRHSVEVDWETKTNWTDASWVYMNAYYGAPVSRNATDAYSLMCAFFRLADFSNGDSVAHFLNDDGSIDTDKFRHYHRLAGFSRQADVAPIYYPTVLGVVGNRIYAGRWSTA